MNVLPCLLTAIGFILPNIVAKGIIHTGILTTDVPITHPDMYKDFHQLWQLDMSNQTSFEFPKDRVLLSHTKLARYFCNNCSVHSIYKQSFSLLPQLTHLELDHNNLHYIHPDAFETNPLLHKVQLIGNHLVNFNPEATLRHVTFLSILILNHNPGFNINQVQMQLPWLLYFCCKYCNTSFVDKSTMSRWQRLGHLHLPNNHIERIDQDAFQEMTRFKYLNIKGNEKLKKMSIQSKTLLYLDAENCGLEGILDTENLPNLETINVRNNKISKINEHAFKKSENIKRILLDENQIEKIPQKLLELTLYKLEALCIDRNPLQPRELLNGFISKYSSKKLRRGCLDDENYSKQFELNLPRKNGVALYTKFSNMHMLTGNSTADYSRRNVVFIERDLFENVPAITKIILDNNTDYDFPNSGAFLQSNFITELSLTDCAITSIHDETFQMLPNIKSINLKGNKITGFHSSKVFQYNPKLEHLNLASNELKFIPPNQFRELKALRSLNLNQNRFLSSESGTPFLISCFLEKLSCQFCGFYQLDEFTLCGLTKLKELDLSNNLIKTVDANAFRSVKQLQRLDLSHNSLSTFKPDIAGMDHVHTLCLSDNEEFDYELPESKILVENSEQMLKLERYCNKDTFSTELLKRYKSKPAVMPYKSAKILMFDSVASSSTTCVQSLVIVLFGSLSAGFVF